MLAELDAAEAASAASSSHLSVSNTTKGGAAKKEGGPGARVKREWGAEEGDVGSVAASSVRSGVSAASGAQRHTKRPRRGGK